jgi:hypothetical protein
MKTVKDLGALVKKKNPRPEYLALSDEEVGEKVKRKHPQKYSQFVGVNIARLVEYYDPSIGRFKSWWRALKSEGRNKLLAQLSPELQALIGMAVSLEDAALNSERKKVELQSFIAQYERQLVELKNYEYLLDRAAAKGRTLETEQAIQTADNDSRNRRAERSQQSRLKLRDDTNQSRLRITEKRAATDEELVLARELSGIKLQEFREMEAIKLNSELQRMQEQVRLALIAKALSSHQRITMVQELIDGLYRQIEETEHSSLRESTKRRMIAIGYRDAEGRRLLQTD